MENIIIEDQLTQAGHFFSYNISTIASPVKDPAQLKVGIIFIAYYVVLLFGAHNINIMVYPKH